jgi:hypothetical protein
MTVQDDLRRLSQLDSIYLGNMQTSYAAGAFTSWYKGRLQQANDGSWIFRSISSDGTVVGFQLSSVYPGWGSFEAPSTGIVVTIPINVFVNPTVQFISATVYLQQQLPQELTN